jgi:hypothetical protein
MQSAMMCWKVWPLDSVHAKNLGFSSMAYSLEIALIEHSSSNLLWALTKQMSALC